MLHYFSSCLVGDTIDGVGVSLVNSLLLVGGRVFVYIGSERMFESSVNSIVHFILECLVGVA